MDRPWKIILGLLLLVVQVSHGVKHDLPDNVEIIDPKSLGLAGADLDKFLGNVKLLPISGNGLLPKDAGGAKTQILTVGFEGDEGLNLDDFELPSVDGLPEAEKSVAKAAFNRFQEFFKNPNKSKLIVNDEDLIDESSMKEDGQGKSSGEVTTTTTATTSAPVETTLTTTTTPLTTTTTTPATLKPRRPVYRPRTTTSNPSSYLNRNRHKVRRPVKFRSTTTQNPLSVDDATTFDPSLYSTHDNMPIFGARFQPQQFQDYASAIRDFQSSHLQQQQTYTRRPAPASDSSEGAPQGLLGFTQVKEPGHNGPPIFDFGGFNPTKKPVNKFRHSSPISSATTERQERTDGGSKIIDYTRTTTLPDYTPNSGNQRFLSNRPHGNEELRQVTAPYQPPNRFRTSTSTSYNVAPPSSQKEYFQHHDQQDQRDQRDQQNQRDQQEYLQGPPPPQPPPVNEEPKLKKPSFEQIVAEPVDAQTVSAKVPFRFPSQEEEHFPAFNEPINDQQKQQQPQQEYQEPRPQPPQYQEQRPQQPQQYQNQRPQPPPQYREPQQQQQQQRSPSQFPEQQPFTTAPEQIRILQQEYQRMAQLKKEHEERAYRLQQELRLQQERTFQLTQQLRLQQKPPQQQAPPKQQQQQQQRPTPPPPQQRPQFSNQQQQPIRPGPIQSNYQPAQEQVQSQVRYNVAPQGPPPPPPQRTIIPLMPIQPQSFRPQGVPIPNERSHAFLPHQILPNPNFLQPHLNDKFISQTETPKHIVRNPINLFNVQSKSPQVYPLATVENARPPQHQHNNRFANVPNNQRQHHHHGPPQQFPPQNFNSRPQFPPQQPPHHHHHQNPHHFSSRALETEEDHRPSGRAQNIQPATLIGTFSLSSKKSKITNPA